MNLWVVERKYGNGWLRLSMAPLDEFNAQATIEHYSRIMFAEYRAVEYAPTGKVILPKEERKG